MNYCSFRIFAGLIFLIFGGHTLGTSQVPAPGQFNRNRSFDARHYRIVTSFDKTRKRIFGETTVSLSPLKSGLQSIELDAVGLSFSSVRLMPGGVPLGFRIGPSSILIELDRSYAPDETIVIELRYDAKPVLGVTFVDAGRMPGRPAHSDQIWTQGEPEYSRHWFPSYDFPDDKATTEQILVVDADETAIANGELLSRNLNDAGKRVFHYRISQPHSVYLTSFVVGKYVKLTDSYNGIPLGFYTYPGAESLTRPAFAPTARMMKIFEELTGVAFPYSKYDQTIVAKFPLGGMENITATTMSDFDVFMVDRNVFIVEDLVSHELAHSWFGNLVTCRNWAELWLNEGFATFMEAVYREKAYGEAEYLRKIRESAEIYFLEEFGMKRKRGLYNRLARPDDSIFDGVTYQKGGVVLHMLRRKIGEEAFWAGVRLFLNRHRFGVVESTDLRAALEETSGRNLAEFFDQWVYGTRFPRLEIEHKYRKTEGILEIRVRQTQPTDQLTPPVFAFVMDVDFQIDGKAERVTLEIDRREQTFSIPVRSVPTAVKVDQDYDIPLKQIKIKKS